MDWLANTLDLLEQQPAIGYSAGALPATEPTALAALALSAHGRTTAAQAAASALADWQEPSGVVSVRAGDDSPGWPTSLAVLTWCACDRERHAARIERGLAWLLANRGKGVPQSPEFGHNSELVGWAFAEHTHSWVEPTAFAVLALKAAGRSADPATREGVALLVDRQLPGGGLNYGNTSVLGQRLRPHLQPTGIALLALRGEADASLRLAKSIAWLSRSLDNTTTPLSLGWSFLGLKAHGASPPGADDWLAAAAQRSPSSTPPAPDGNPPPARDLHKRALLALAAKGWPL